MGDLIHLHQFDQFGSRFVGIFGASGSGPHREHDRFAREVARMLDHGVADGRCAGLVLVATNPFLGRLKHHLGEQAQKLILRTLSADYTTLEEAELGERLQTAAAG